MLYYYLFETAQQLKPYLLEAGKIQSARVVKGVVF